MHRQGPQKGLVTQLSPLGDLKLQAAVQVGGSGESGPFTKEASDRLLVVLPLTSKQKEQAREKRSSPFVAISGLVLIKLQEEENRVFPLSDTIQGFIEWNKQHILTLAISWEEKEEEEKKKG